MAEMQSDPGVYPVIYGNELESSVMLQRRRLVYDELFPGDDRFATVGRTFEEPRNVRAFIPRELQVNPNMPFLQNGFKVYDGNLNSCTGPQRIELATPECSSLSQLVTSTRVAEMILERGASSLLQRNQESDINGIRIQKRVVDTEGNTWGCHDNYGFTDDRLKAIKGGLPVFMGRFVASRCFITGAGRYGESGYEFSQKIGFTKEDEGYGFFSRHYRDAGGLGENVKRIEVGSSDPNISDWATSVRVGSVALLLAILATSNEEKIRRYFEDDLYENSVLAYGISRNSVAYDKESGGVKLTREQLHSVGMQRAVAETFLDSVADKTGSPKELRNVASEIIQYCDDFISVTNEVKTVEDLADRADWAARLVYIEDRAAKKPGGKDEKTVKRMADVNFDATFLERGESGRVLIHHGHGFKLRARSQFKGKVNDKEVSRHYEVPPATRGAARVALLGSGHKIDSADWNQVTLRLGRKKRQRIQLPDATNPEVPKHAVKYLSVTQTEQKKYS